MYFRKKNRKKMLIYENLVSFSIHKLHSPVHRIEFNIYLNSFNNQYLFSMKHYLLLPENKKNMTISLMVLLNEAQCVQLSIFY